MEIISDHNLPVKNDYHAFFFLFYMQDSSEITNVNFKVVIIIIVSILSYKTSVCVW